MKKSMSSKASLIMCFLVLFFYPFSARSEEDPVNTALSLYKQLQEWRFSEHHVTVPDAGITWSLDCGSWTLESGKIWQMEPTPGGICTGLYFEGNGRFRMKIPDPIEIEQFKRFSGKDFTGTIDEPFTRLVIRSAAPFLTDIISLRKEATYIPHDIVRQRHENWLRLAKLDVDARIVAGLFNPGDDFICIDMDTEGFGWLTFLFDPLAIEEVQLQKHKEKYEYVEIWMSLDRASERNSAGMPSTVRHDQIDITHVDIAADLTKWSLPVQPIQGDIPITERATFRSAVTFVPLESGDYVLLLDLHPKAYVTSVSTPDGKNLPFIRDPIGKRFYSIDSDIHDMKIYVILDTPLLKGEKRTILIDYELKISNFVSGKNWYPSIIDTFNDLHTVSFAITLNKKYDVLAVGKLQKETVNDKLKTWLWETEMPARMYGFTIGEKFKKERIQLDSIPEVISFGTTKGFSTGNMVRNVAIDVAKSLHFYRWFFDIDFPLEKIHATSVRSWHGQAFPGFLHLAEYTYQAEHPGASELFRAHEVAHQMWGHMVSWKSYRDQWLSEALAEYSAMLFIETTMSKSGYYYEILKIYTNELFGSFESSMSKFARPWDIMDIRRFGEKIGPIGVGYRAGTAEIPSAYYFQVYHKGPLVIHMLRIILRSTTTDDKLFREILKDFLHTYNGKEASTEDFKSIIEKHTRSDWRWFFDQWINGTALPTYEWSYKLSERPNQEGFYELKVKVDQRDVPPGFKMPVPLWVEFPDKSIRQFTLNIDTMENSFTLAVQQRPKNVLFNPYYSVLAKTKKK